MSLRVEDPRYFRETNPYTIYHALQNGQWDVALIMFKMGAMIEPDKIKDLKADQFLRDCIRFVDPKIHKMNPLDFVVLFGIVEDFNKVVEQSSEIERNEALFLAFEKQIPSMVFLLVMSGAALELTDDENRVDPLSYNLIVVSKQRGCIELNMKKFLIQSLRMEEYSESDKKLLHWMLDALYSINFAKKGTHSTIWDAINSVNSVAIVQALREATDLNVTNPEGQLPLHELLKRKILPTVELVLEAVNNFANPLLRDGDGMNAFYYTRDPHVWNILSARIGVSYDDIALEVKGLRISDEENREPEHSFRYVEVPKGHRK